MVHALRRARQHLSSRGALVLIQPDHYKRPRIAVVSKKKREPVTALISPIGQPLINAAYAAIDTVIEERLFERTSLGHHHFTVRLANPTELHRYLHQGIRPPRFPRGARQRLEALWRSRPSRAQIEVMEFLTVISLRPK